MKMLTVTIEPMADGDIPDIQGIDPPSHMTDAQLREELARPWARLWVARGRTRKAVGFLIAWHVADELHVLNVATHPEHRRRGIGRALMRKVADYAREHKLRHVLLEVRRSNVGAIALYRETGFFAMGVRPRYYPDDEDAVEMVLLLDAATGEIVRRPDEVRI
jgi:ribosomal-protein-alanine N-acetyltransferase